MAPMAGELKRNVDVSLRADDFDLAVGKMGVEPAEEPEDKELRCGYARNKPDRLQLPRGVVLTAALEPTLSAKEAAGYYVKERREILPFIPKRCRTLLDVGCATAEFGALVKKEIGAEVWGVEICPKVAAIAATKIERVVNSYFGEEANVPDAYFDVITFNDSLEHFPDPFPPLTLAKRKLKRDGTLVCSLPNVRCADNLRHLLAEMDWRYEEYGVRDKTHLRFFTRKSMIRTIEEAGYAIISVNGINPSDYYSHNWKLRILRQFLGKWMQDMLYQQYIVVATPKA